MGVSEKVAQTVGLTRRSIFLLAVPALRPLAHLRAASVEVRIDTEQANAVLALATGMGDWEAVAMTEGYIRLKRREAQIGRAFTAEEFRAFCESKEVKRRAARLRMTLHQWSKTQVNQLASRALAYLPPNAAIRATTYIVVKPRSNNFVFEASTDPAIFVYLDPAATREEVENTVVHELHHIGLASFAAEMQRKYAPLSPNVRAAAEWLAAFGEGLAMLAAAGALDVDPHRYSSRGDRQRWRDALARFETDRRKLEAFLLDVVQGRLSEVQQRERGMSFFGIQGPWYTVGWRMAVTIERVLGRGALIACMPDMRYLLPGYNEAARATEGSLWSEQLISALAIG